MDITSDTAVRLPTIEVRPKATPDAGTPAVSTDDTKPDFWHRAFGKDGFSFSTLLDIVNPLQHIPIVSTIYQKLTGDVASPGANIIGGALFGGPIGLAVASADTAVKSETGKDIGGHVLAMFDSSTSGDAPSATAIASAADAIAPTTDAGTASATATASAGKNTAPVTVLANAAEPAAKPATKTATAPGTTSTFNPETKTPKPITPARVTTPFPFAMGKRHPAGNGIGGSFVPLETRAYIAPAAWQIPTAPLDSSLTDGATKPTQKQSDATVPDLQTLASNPDMLRQLMQNGLRKQAMKPPLANAASTTVNAKPAQPVPSAAAPVSMIGSAGTSASADNATNSNDNADYASLMARNLARYMALQNKNAAPKVNQRY